MLKLKSVIIILSAIFVRGTMCDVEAQLTVSKDSDIKNDKINLREAQELVNRGVAADEADIEIEEDNTVPIEKLKRDDLVEYVTSDAGLGLEIDEAWSMPKIRLFVELNDMSTEELLDHASSEVLQVEDDMTDEDIINLIMDAA